jgi:oxaloacetate decarboxylase alpha subunit
MGRPELFPRVVEEAVRVREDLGWPIVVTPFAQYIVTQASINVITGERYSRITDEIVDLLHGEFGSMPGKIDEDLLDRASRTARARRVRTEDEPTIAALRAKLGPSLSDEDLLLRAVMPAEQVDAMVGRRTAGRSGGLSALLDALSLDGELYSVSVRGGGAAFAASGAGTEVNNG